MKTATGAAALAAGAHGAETAHPTAADTFGLLKRGKKIPVIFDTDIGGDIDDTWALCMLLKCPELDVKLVASDAGNTTYRARILAKMLEVFKRTDIPIAVGIPPGDNHGHQSDWIEGYSLDHYPGTIHEDGVGAIVDTVKASPDPVTIVCIGGVPNLRAALERDPSIVSNARFVGMHGSIRRGYGEGSQPRAEANVRADPQALRAVFAAPWDCTITPLDTCDRVKLRGEKYQKVYQCDHPTIQALMENYRIWKPTWLRRRPDTTKGSTTLFDTVAVYLAFSQDLLVMEDLPLRVTDDGRTVVDDGQRTIHCAMDWRDLEAFEDLLVERLVA
ncbi:MAG: nucleoside hydrolase [Armatimonadota bacterium]